MLQLGTRIRLTASEIKRIERITGASPAHIRSLDELLGFFRERYLADPGDEDWKRLRRAAIEQEFNRLVRAMPAATYFGVTPRPVRNAVSGDK